MLFDKISADELEMISNYRHWYAYSNESNSQHGSFVSNNELLREWDARKSEYLNKLFGDALIISKKVKYTKSFDELEEEISDMTSQYSRYGRVGRNGYEFQKAWGDFMYNNRNLLTSNQKEGLHQLMSDECLIENIYDGNSFEVDDEQNGKKFRVNRGAKVSKTLGKLANIFDLPGYEDFRICHSQILNQKDIEGTLTLSIHPLDYMTMSDNAYGWESCMSWSNEGGYRQGTVEMMNSKSVVVAYLAGDRPYRMSDYESPALSWNSKKWRQLFVVDKNVIIGVKDYPFNNDNLTKVAVEWLKELAAERLGWTYDNLEKYVASSTKFHRDYLPDNKNDFAFEFLTGAMYNDFGCLDFHWMCLSDNIDPDEIHAHDGVNWRCTPWMTIPYSGKSQCMVCGDLNPNYEDESCLACEECQERTRCDCCGDISDEVWSIDGVQLCNYCWENRVHECIACGEEHYDENIVPIYVIPRISEEKRQELRADWINSNGPWCCSFAKNDEDLRNCEYNFFKDENPNGWICYENHKCFEKFVKECLKPGERPHMREKAWSREICVYLDQLSEWGITELAWGFENDNEGYIESFRGYHIQPTRFIELL
jgi:hypothetical protein